MTKKNRNTDLVLLSITIPGDDLRAVETIAFLEGKKKTQVFRELLRTGLSTIRPSPYEAAGDPPEKAPPPDPPAPPPLGVPYEGKIMGMPRKPKF